jgi:Mg2+ and Co2+ transporter CorA
VFKVIDLGPEGKPEESEDSEGVGPPPAGTVRWVDVIRADAASLDLLRERSSFHPLALEDCATFEARSMLDDDGDHPHVMSVPPFGPSGAVPVALVGWFWWKRWP